jgi:hypothetical protein
MSEKENPGTLSAGARARGVKHEDDTARLVRDSRGEVKGGHPPTVTITPVFLCTEVPKLKPTSPRTVQFLCACGRIHRHGWPEGDAEVGHRVGHCPRSAGRGYILVARTEGAA